MFMTRSLFRNKWEQKQRVPDTYYINNDNAMQILRTLWMLHRIRHNAKSAERQKTSFPKKSVENADLFKTVLNKKMTTHE